MTAPPPDEQRSVSVVMPSLNAAPWIERAVRSALDQRVALEVIVQDGGSSDGTLGVLAGISDPRLRIDSRADEGQSDALNRAIGRARGEWIAWLNADDELIPGALAAALAAAPPGGDVLVGDFETIDASGRTLRRHRGAALERRRLLLRGCYAFSGATLIRRRVFADYGGFARNLHMAMDYEFFLRIAPEVESVHLALPLGRYRRHPDTKSSTRRRQTFCEAGRIRRCYARTVPGASLWGIGQIWLGLYGAAKTLRCRRRGRRRAARARTHMRPAAASGCAPAPAAAPDRS